ncbi:uncharacterized protein LOC132700752 isoform X2 [Cylas formicarius]|uniref:uncharacterized protein LOC132700752 isoform X2 n=1 Tax=Cylas formicarius TaxID=197179 RepID=UPI002958350F|nr:uncharacterized protein LOC132700752 isoform X2 [Cylas formicarius]
MFNPRFNFGVPLEDIFPSDDVHPRLKYLFSKAYDVLANNNGDMEIILRRQGSLSERLSLRDKLVLDTTFDWQFPPGVYLWTIRHFLGLLPLPVLPRYTNNVTFFWTELSRQCRVYLKNDADDSELDHLDRGIAETMSLLPVENLMMLNLWITFSMKISCKSVRGRQFTNRRNLVNIAKYYCSAIFVRPFQPGYMGNNEAYLPLLLYLMVRWKQVQNKMPSKSGRPAPLLKWSLRSGSNHNRSRLKDNWSQTITIHPNINNINENYAQFKKEIGCQTETELLTYIEEQEDPTLFQTAAEFSFRSLLDEPVENDWEQISKETADTVKKVEEYIYDDYETFEKEDFNQILDGRKGDSFINKISKFGWTYTPNQIERMSTPKHGFPNDSGYVKYDDIFEEEESVSTDHLGKDICDAKLNKETTKNKKDRVGPRLKTKKFMLNKIRMSLECLKMLTPKKTNIKYECLKAVHSNTM